MINNEMLFLFWDSLKIEQVNSVIKYYETSGTERLYVIAIQQIKTFSIQT